jgi:hypothetical protein
MVENRRFGRRDACHQPPIKVLHPPQRVHDLTAEDQPGQGRALWTKHDER